MHSQQAVKKHIESIKKDLIERYKSWIEVALLDMEDNTELTTMSIEGFQSDLEQLIRFANQLGKSGQTYERTEEK